MLIDMALYVFCVVQCWCLRVLQDTMLSGRVPLLQALNLGLFLLVLIHFCRKDLGKTKRSHKIAESLKAS